MIRARSTHQHIETCEMAELFIKDEFKYNLLLSPLPLSTDEKEIDENLSHVNIINLEIKREFQTSSIVDITRSTFNDLVSEDEGNIVLFHGTDHQSACDILSRRIDLRRGRRKRDFSCGSGFYLTSSLDDALNWANSTTAKPAVLIFQVNRREYLDDDDRKLNLCEKEERWREIVSLFRSDKLTAKTQRSFPSA
ncbi:hypothetical protein OS493_037278 [Desmophyllum pertusum]|uniref:Uncharacterized protein n=1 Tax=Desmophyllum pertusum TaxID=174260 RepID=A0A9X0CCL5_9CNID|nr:hypothetical protein OS493_037278 [Desmophyllum pertusum]